MQFITYIDSKTNPSIVVLHIKKDDTKKGRLYPRLRDKAVLIWSSAGGQGAVGEAESLMHSQNLGHES